MAQAVWFKLQRKCLSSFILVSHGACDEVDEGDEVHEGYEGYEGHEGHEGQEEEQDRKRQARKGQRLPWKGRQGEDHGWLDEGRFDEEQAWKDCEQEIQRRWKEGLQKCQGLDRRFHGGQKGTWREGVRRCQKGQRSLHQDQVFVTKENR